jgi:hypothetical protein
VLAVEEAMNLSARGSHTKATEVGLHELSFVQPRLTPLTTSLSGNELGLLRTTPVVGRIRASEEVGDGLDVYSIAESSRRETRGDTSVLPSADGGNDSDLDGSRRVAMQDPLYSQVIDPLRRGHVFPVEAG